MKELLKNYFGYDSFRPMQEEIINSIIQKKDTFVLMPTGGGKSLCYQLPALKFEGLTIVISPLISLMKDQVDSLKANGISAEFINSMLSNAEIDSIKNRALEGKIKIIYIAPERFAMENFREFLKSLNISLIAVDEAHCISEWGHDFRPEYRNLNHLKKMFPDTPIIALTATATKQVTADIIKHLLLNNPSIFISSFNRKNLNLIVLKKQDSFHKIRKMLKEYKDESVIIYCFSRKDTESISNNLRKHGFNALPYHAGLNSETRKQNQEMFIKDKVNIIVATIAFGMGIDKPNVRLIIHHTFPKSLEGYYQEIGRAGRDGLSSDCVMFYSRSDKFRHEYFINKIEDLQVQLTARTKLAKIMGYCESVFCRRKYILNYFDEVFHEANCKGCDICIGFSQEDLSKLSQTIPRQVLNYDKKLFEILRNLRKKLAIERKVAPFIIFSDVSLQEMAFYLPRRESELLGVEGVGVRKLKDFGALFLETINNYAKENNLAAREIPRKIEKIGASRKSRHLIEYYHKTKELLLEKLPVEKIARIEGLKESTVIYHIEKLIDSGEKIDLYYLFPFKEHLEKIKFAFGKLGLRRLAPVYEYFNKEFSYDNLRLARALIKSERLIDKKDPNTGESTSYHERLAEIKKNFLKAYESWTSEDDEKLRALYYSEKKSISEIALLIARQPSAIRSRLKKIGFFG